MKKTSDARAQMKHPAELYLTSMSCYSLKTGHDKKLLPSFD